MAAKAARSVKLWTPRLAWEERANGEFIIWREDELGPYPNRLNERLIHWAQVAPDRIWMADRAGTGPWREVTYREALDLVRRIGQFLLSQGLSAERPLVILSENSIEHALMALGAQHVGVPSAAIAPAYASASSGFAKLREIAGQIAPGMIFVDNGAGFAPAVDAVFGPDMPIVAVRDLPPARANGHAFAPVAATEPTAAVDIYGLGLTMWECATGKDWGVIGIALYASPDHFCHVALSESPQPARKHHIEMHQNYQGRWTYAKTMPLWPHEYIVRERVDEGLFVRLVEHIRAHGYEGHFYRKPITYYDADGMVYWTMGAPVEETVIVNRCREDATFEYRLEHGTLPR
mgnify:CR=1 FL=1